MKTFDRYLFRELFKLFAVVLLVISIAFVIQRLIFLTEWSMHRGIGFLGVLKLLLYLFPGLFLTAIPLVSLFVIILVLSQMCEENQLVVMMSCGRDLNSLSLVVLKFSLISTILTAYLSFFLTPKSVQKFYLLRWELVQAKSEKALPTQQFIEFNRDTLIYVQNKDRQGLENVILYQGKSGEQIFSQKGPDRNIVFAKQARILNSPGKNEGMLYLKKGVFISHQKEPELDQFLQFEQALARLDFTEVQELEQKMKAEVNMRSLSDLLEMYQNPSEFRDQSKTRSRKEMGFLKQVRVELAQRMNQVLSCLLLSLWGIGLGIKPPRTSKTISYLLGVSAGFGYYYLNVLCKALALKKLLPIELALFSPALLILLTGTWLVQKRRQGREPLNFLYQMEEYLRQWRRERRSKD